MKTLRISSSGKTSKYLNPKILHSVNNEEEQMDFKFHSSCHVLADGNVCGGGFFLCFFLPYKVQTCARCTSPAPPYPTWSPGSFRTFLFHVPASTGHTSPVTSHKKRNLSKWRAQLSIGKIINNVQQNFITARVLFLLYTTAIFQRFPCFFFSFLKKRFIKEHHLVLFIHLRLRLKLTGPNIFFFCCRNRKAQTPLESWKTYLYRLTSDWHRRLLPYT